MNFLWVLDVKRLFLSTTLSMLLASVVVFADENPDKSRDFWARTQTVTLSPSKWGQGQYVDLYPLSDSTPLTFSDLERAVQNQSPSTSMDTLPLHPWTFAFRLVGEEEHHKDDENTPFQSETEHELVLHLWPSVVDFVRLICRISTDGQIHEILLDKNRYFTERPYGMIGINVPINFHRFHEMQCFMPLSVSSPTTPRVFVRTERDLIQMRLMDMAWDACYFGIVLGLAFYNLLLFFFLKDRTYLLYFLTTIFVHILIQLWMNGYDTYLFPVSSPWWNVYGGFLLVYLSGISLVQFASAFLGCTSRMAIWSLRALTGLNAVGIALMPLVPPSWSMKLASICGAFSITLPLLRACFKYFAEKDRVAGTYTLAWSFPTVGAIILVLRELRILPPNFLFDNTLQIGSALETILLAIGLGYRYRKFKEESDRKDLELKEKRIELENERAHSTIQRVEVGAKLSDDLNSPVMALQNISEQLNQRLVKLDNVASGGSSEELFKSVNSLLKYWSLGGKQMTLSLQSLKVVSSELEGLREATDPAIETTAILKRYNRDLTDSTYSQTLAPPPKDPPRS